MVILTALAILLFHVFADEEKIASYLSQPFSHSVFQPENKSENMQGLSVEFIDVGQGDSTLIVCNGKSMLIDCGEKEYYRIIQSHLKEKGIEKIDYAVATHPHSDHIGSMDRIISDFEIGTFIMPSVSEKIISETEVYKRMRKALDENSINVQTLSAGDSFMLSEAEISVIGPSGEYDNLNDTSLVLMLTYGESKFLFTGDIEEDGEEAVLKSGADLKCDVLKVAHNGSDTSTCDEFLKKADPDIAVISVGAGNGYGHPNKKVIEKLLKSGAMIYRTDDDGTVSFSVSSKNSEIVED